MTRPKRTTPKNNDYQQDLIELAIRTLWIAFVWNNKEYEPAHLFAQNSVRGANLFSIEDANAFLAKFPDKEGRIRAMPGKHVATIKALRETMKNIQGGLNTLNNYAIRESNVKDIEKRVAELCLLYS